MKAAVRSKYGLPGDLSIKDLDKPIPNSDEIVIKVHAISVNRSDCHVLSGKPYVMRLLTGLFKPRESIIGCDFAGEIEAIGDNVTAFKKGQKIMGFGGGLGCGSHAQYFKLPEKKAKKVMVEMPANINYIQVAACLEGAFYASCIEILNIKPEHKTLVFGATGAIGSSYVQFLKYYNAYVTAVCAAENSDLVKSLGADKIIDYKTQDFTKDDERYDFIFDAIGKTNFFKCKPLLKKNGMFTSSGGAENLFLLLITPIFKGKMVFYRPPKSIMSGLSFIKRLIEEEKFKPVIDRIYPLETITDAFTYVASGQKIGNVIINMGH